MVTLNITEGKNEEKSEKDIEIERERSSAEVTQARKLKNTETD